MYLMMQQCVQVTLIEQEYVIRQEVCREFGEQLIEIEERHRCGGGEWGLGLPKALIQKSGVVFGD